MLTTQVTVICGAVMSGLRFLIQVDLISKDLTFNNSKGGFFSERADAFVILQTDKPTLESGINIALRLLLFLLFSRGYGLIPDSIEPI